MLCFQMHRVETESDLLHNGDFVFLEGTERYDYFLLCLTPNGVWRLPVCRGSDVSGWNFGWDGDKNCPTITPPVTTLGKWAGQICKGELEEIVIN
jgi:hypothetical protein